jgi:hypothetical protein
MLAIGNRDRVANHHTQRTSSNTPPINTSKLSKSQLRNTMRAAYQFTKCVATIWTEEVRCQRCIDLGLARETLRLLLQVIDTTHNTRHCKHSADQHTAMRSSTIRTFLRATNCIAPFWIVLLVATIPALPPTVPPTTAPTAAPTPAPIGPPAAAPIAAPLRVPTTRPPAAAPRGTS